MTKDLSSFLTNHEGMTQPISLSKRLKAKARKSNNLVGSGYSTSCFRPWRSSLRCCCLHTAAFNPPRPAFAAVLYSAASTQQHSTFVGVLSEYWLSSQLTSVIVREPVFSLWFCSRCVILSHGLCGLDRGLYLERVSNPSSFSRVGLADSMQAL